MAIGKSNRIVVEVEIDFKEQIYLALKSRGLTFKEWLVEQAAKDLLSSTATKDNPSGEGRKNKAYEK